MWDVYTSPSPPSSFNLLRLRPYLTMSILPPLLLEKAQRVPPQHLQGRKGLYGLKTTVMHDMAASSVKTRRVPPRRCRDSRVYGLTELQKRRI